MQSQAEEASAGRDASARAQIAALVESALAITLRDLSLHGNAPGVVQRNALRDLLIGLSHQALSGGKARVAYPLDTGLGKSTALKAWIQALWGHPALRGTPIAVLCQKVEALCGIKRQLIERGVAEADVGLMHSLGAAAPLPADADAASRPILLATHARTSVASGMDALKFQGQPRRLHIWDESLIANRGFSYPIVEAQSLLHGLKPYLAGDVGVMEALRSISRMLTEDAQALQSGRVPQRRLFAVEAAAVDLALRKARPQRGWMQAAKVEAQTDFLACLTQECQLIVVRGAMFLASHSSVVPPELAPVAVLDASYPLRLLCQADRSLCCQEGWHGPVKSWRNVTVKRSRAASGRTAVEDSLFGEERAPGLGFAAYVEECLRQIPHSAKVLVFTFKARDGSPSFVEAIRRHLAKAGIDPDELAPDGSLRIAFRTWGEETAINDHADAEHVILAGVLHRRPDELVAQWLAQHVGAGEAPSDEFAQSLVDSEVAHCVLQAASRGACRRVESGEALPMTLWLPMYSNQVSHLLQAAMPGVCWQDAFSTALGAQPTDTQVAADAARHYLLALAPSVTSISSRSLRAAVPELVRSSNSTATRAMSQGAALAGWIKQGRSWRRVETKRQVFSYLKTTEENSAGARSSRQPACALAEPDSATTANVDP